jgi:hypothetical protein
LVALAIVLVGVHIPQDDPELLEKRLKEEKKEDPSSAHWARPPADL